MNRDIADLQVRMNREGWLSAPPSSILLREKSTIYVNSALTLFMQACDGSFKLEITGPRDAYFIWRYVGNRKWHVLRLCMSAFPQLYEGGRGIGLIHVENSSDLNSLFRVRSVNRFSE